MTLLTMEYIDVVNDKDEVVGSISREESYANCNRRGAYVLLYNSKNELLLQKRSEKVHNPNMWFVSAAGHVSSGETYEEAAYRELKEELSITAKLTFIEKISEIISNRILFMGVFYGTSDREIKIDNDEVSDYIFISEKELPNFMKKNKIHPRLKLFYEKKLLFEK